MCLKSSRARPRPGIYAASEWHPEAMPEWRSYLSHLTCSMCGLHHEADRLQTVCTACGKVLLAQYDLDALRGAVRPADFATRRFDMWRYAELLPVRDPSQVVSL